MRATKLQTARDGEALRRPRRRVAVLVLAIAAGLVGCEEQQVQDREYKSQPAELRQALGLARDRAERLEVLDLMAAVEDIVARSHPELLDAVRPIVDDPDPMLAAKAADVLSQWGDDYVLAALARMLRHSDPWVRLSAASSLAVLDHPDAVPLAAEATGDAEANVRAQACRALAEIRLPLSGRNLQLLRERLADDHPSVRAAAATALGRVGNADDHAALRAALGDANEGVVAAAADALGRMDDRGAVPLLVGVLTSGTQATRVAAAAALGRIRDPEVVPALIDQLGHSDSIVRGEVMRSLSELDDPRAMMPILGLALDDDPLIQGYVPFVAASLYEPSHFEMFRANLNDDAFEVRGSAALALGLAGEDRAIPLLRERLRDPHHRVRIGAVRALGILGAAEAIDDLENAWHYDPNPQVRDAAEVGLALAKIEGTSLADRLMRGLTSDTPAVRLESVSLLTALDDKRAIDALRLRLRDEDRLIRYAARFAIKTLLDE